MLAVLDRGEIDGSGGRDLHVHRSGPFSGSGAGIGRIVADDDGLDHRENLVAGHADLARMLADRFRVPRLVDADRAEAAVWLLDYIAANPADAVRHLVVADLGRFGAGGFEFLNVSPGARPANDIKIHDCFSYLDWAYL